MVYVEDIIGNCIAILACCAHAGLTYYEVDNFIDDVLSVCLSKEELKGRMQRHLLSYAIPLINIKGLLLESVYDRLLSMHGIYSAYGWSDVIEIQWDNTRIYLQRYSSQCEVRYQASFDGENFLTIYNG